MPSSRGLSTHLPTLNSIFCKWSPVFLHIISSYVGAEGATPHKVYIIQKLRHCTFRKGEEFWKKLFWQEISPVFLTFSLIKLVGKMKNQKLSSDYFHKKCFLSFSKEKKLISPPAPTYGRFKIKVAKFRNPSSEICIFNMVIHLTSSRFPYHNTATCVHVTKSPVCWIQSSYDLEHFVYYLRTFFEELLRICIS